MGIRLTINHSTVAKDRAPGTLMRALYHLRDHQNPSFNSNILDARLHALTLSALARRWFLINRPNVHADANEQILKKKLSS